ncbi:hypothetical protein BS47DRAFT_1363631 [Hydnum rufescens UP504]|uniref:Uncharacterized protein n=1 Tax=Hydnum rufescens UP504 TaxID=1448309 RepID=A0A9P6DR41_9AGAM|nr:hypothetical protein BS47DRAFT_1363631 [Hydnum rufescens UP504]
MLNDHARNSELVRVLRRMGNAQSQQLSVTNSGPGSFSGVGTCPVNHGGQRSQSDLPHIGGQRSLSDLPQVSAVRGVALNVNSSIVSSVSPSPCSTQITPLIRSPQKVEFSTNFDESATLAPSAVRARASTGSAKFAVSVDSSGCHAGVWKISWVALPRESQDFCCAGGSLSAGSKVVQIQSDSS